MGHAKVSAGARAPTEVNGQAHATSPSVSELVLLRRIYRLAAAWLTFPDDAHKKALHEAVREYWLQYDGGPKAT